MKFQVSSALLEDDKNPACSGSEESVLPERSSNETQGEHYAGQFNSDPPPRIEPSGFTITRIIETKRSDSKSAKQLFGRWREEFQSSAHARTGEAECTFIDSGHGATSPRTAWGDESGRTDGGDPSGIRCSPGAHVAADVVYTGSCEEAVLSNGGWEVRSNCREAPREE